jgi:cell division protein FtsN
MSPHEKELATHKWAILTVMLLGLVLVAFLVPDQEAEIQKQKQQDVEITQMEPYGGCDEAWRYPKTEGYATCKEMGLVP